MPKSSHRSMRLRSQPRAKEVSLYLLMRVVSCTSFSFFDGMISAVAITSPEAASAAISALSREVSGVLSVWRKLCDLMALVISLGKMPLRICADIVACLCGSVFVKS